MKLFLLTFCFCFVLIESFSQEYPFAEYYYNLNLAIDAKDKISKETDSLYFYTNNLYNNYLRKAYEVLPLNNRNRIHKSHYANLLKYFYFKSGKGNANVNINDINTTISFIKNTPIIGAEDELFAYIDDKGLQGLVHQYQTYYSIDTLLQQNTEIVKEIELIYLIDQYIRGAKHIDSVDVPLAYRYLSVKDGDQLVFMKMLNLFRKVEIKDKLIFKKYDMFIPLVHLTNFDNYKILEPYIVELIIEGFLTPNEFAWIYDRSYNNKFGTFYYYYSLNQPFNDSKYILEEDLTPEQKDEINYRRKEIGIPPIPYKFTFISSGLR